VHGMHVEAEQACNCWEKRCRTNTAVAATTGVHKGQSLMAHLQFRAFSHLGTSLLSVISAQLCLAKGTLHRYRHASGTGKVYKLEHVDATRSFHWRSPVHLACPPWVALYGHRDSVLWLTLRTYMSACSLDPPLHPYPT
jgi:hypothetical protein